MAGRPPTCTCGTCRTCLRRAYQDRNREHIREANRAHRQAQREREATLTLEDVEDWDMERWLRLRAQDERRIVAAYLAKRVR
jgi:hypothetical protein